MPKYDVGERVTFRNLRGTEETGEVWSFGHENAQRWVTTAAREFALLTFAREGASWQEIDGQWTRVPYPESLREVQQDWRALLRAVSYAQN